MKNSQKQIKRVNKHKVQENNMYKNENEIHLTVESANKVRSLEGCRVESKYIQTIYANDNED